MKVNGRKILGYSVLPILLLLTCALQPVAAAQMTSVGIDCSQIHALGIMQQENMRAGRVLIECGILPGGHPDSTAGAPTAPPNIRVSNRKCTDSSSCTKSENMVWASTKDNGMTIVDNYNDHNAVPTDNYSGISYSTDGGAHFTEILPPPFNSDHGFNLGDPIVVFNSKLNKWFAGDLVGNCGGQGIGLWTSTDAKKWKVGVCAHTGGGDDRESMWVDNEPTSGKYGRMYISWGDYAANGATSVIHSDDGVTWSVPVRLNSGNPFIRNVQVTGSPVGAARFEGKNSTVFIAGMDEGGGGLSNRPNVF
jgi:hypothetical protein